LGAGAERFGFPSAVRGIPALGYFSHWAEPGAEVEDRRTAHAAVARADLNKKAVMFIGIRLS